MIRADSGHDRPPTGCRWRLRRCGAATRSTAPVPVRNLSADKGDGWSRRTAPQRGGAAAGTGHGASATAPPPLSGVHREVAGRGSGVHDEWGTCAGRRPMALVLIIGWVRFRWHVWFGCARDSLPPTTRRQDGTPRDRGRARDEGAAVDQRSPKRTGLARRGVHQAASGSPCRAGGTGDRGAAVEPPGRAGPVEGVVRAAGVRGDQQPVRVRMVHSPTAAPPAADGFGGEPGGVMVRPDVDPAGVGG